MTLLYLYNGISFLILLIIANFAILNIVRYHGDIYDRKRYFMLLFVVFMTVHVIRVVQGNSTGFFLMLAMICLLLVYDVFGLDTKKGSR